MRVLVACEFSGTVRDAFIDQGHDAISCDILPTESPGPHYQGDIRDVLAGEARWIGPEAATAAHSFDLLIAHPPCTYLSNSGVRWLYGGKGTVIDWDRWAKMEDGAEFFNLFLNSGIPRIAVENPIMHGFGRKLVGGGATQIVQPWQFGTGETKATGLWLRNLPPLVPTDIVDGRHARVHLASPGPNRGHERSRTDRGIARAMAQQWGSLPVETEAAA